MIGRQLIMAFREVLSKFHNGIVLDGDSISLVAPGRSVDECLLSITLHLRA